MFDVVTGFPKFRLLVNHYYFLSTCSLFCNNSQISHVYGLSMFSVTWFL